jgi:hypothetical protein
MSTGSITLRTHLDGDHDSRQINLTEHDAIHTLSEKCAAAWPQTFRAEADIKTIFYHNNYNEKLIESCSGIELIFIL